MVARLQMDGFQIPLKQRQHISRLRHDIEKAEELLNVLQIHNERSYNNFVKCLRSLKLDKPASVLEKGISMSIQRMPARNIWYYRLVDQQHVFISTLGHYIHLSKLKLSILRSAVKNVNFNVISRMWIKRIASQNRSNRFCCTHIEESKKFEKVKPSYVEYVYLSPMILVSIKLYCTSTLMT